MHAICACLNGESFPPPLPNLEVVEEEQAALLDQAGASADFAHDERS